MRHRISCTVLIVSLIALVGEAQDKSLLDIDRIYSSVEFTQQHLQPYQWIDHGDGYIVKEKTLRGSELVRYDSKSMEKSSFLSVDQLRPSPAEKPIEIESYSLSPDQSKVLIFNNSERVWRTNTKGDYWVFDKHTGQLSRLGEGLPASSLMFAKFSSDNVYVAYVHEFNLYVEDFKSGVITQLTHDGSKDIINGTFDWVYEEEFGCRDGFRWNESASHIAYWQLDASQTGVFYMINNTDSIYPTIVPMQYPKVGQAPSACQVGIIDMISKETVWIELPGESDQNYIPAIQWIDNQVLLIQQLNRLQNHLTMWSYDLNTKTLKTIYEEVEETWVDIKYPDITANGWSRTDMFMANDGRSFYRMSETDGWRHIYEIDREGGPAVLKTPGAYDVASVLHSGISGIYYIASPDDPTQRYLYYVDHDGKKKRLTPTEYGGVNRYDVSPNGKYAFHTHTSVSEPSSVRLISLPDHQEIQHIISNDIYQRQLSKLQLPEIEFFQVTTEEGIEIEGRMIKPVGFNPKVKYPVLFHVYGEPWGQVATDQFVGLYNIMMAQKGYVIIDMDNRGTPSLKGSDWRKSIYGKVGILNTRDQALAAKEVLKWPYIDAERTAVWGWSGGGSMTLNLLFRYPEIYKTGVAVAAVAYQLAYDNIYQERYMGLPSENMEDYIEGSPISQVDNFSGNLLLIHGTADDNVHYQHAEMLINELVKYNKQFDLMIYPNRSHGIWEGKGTTKHLYTLLTNYLIEHCPPNENSSQP